MKYYNTSLEALIDLKDRGYTSDFSIESNGIYCPGLDLRLSPQDFHIDEYYRFEGMTSPDESSVVYAISSTDGVKGILIDAYGVYAENLNFDMAKKLTISHVF
jgi:hypothetical protein